MAVSTRVFFIASLLGLSTLIFLAYVYLNDYEKRRQLLTGHITLANGTRISIQDSKSILKTNNDLGTEKKPLKGGNLGFVHAFIASISVIVVSELGDKTFFIAAIMAMRHSRSIIYGGAMGALGAMTILSALLGNIVTQFVPRIYTYYLSSILFAGFGVKMLKDGYAMSPDEGAEEYKEVQQEVEEAEAADDPELGGQTKTNASKQKEFLSKFVMIVRRYVSPILIQAFILTFLAEWGDRSQITTIVLAASENLLGVIVGGTIGHGLCTGLAVIGGRFVAQRISPKTVTLVGGVVFLCFALSAFFIRPES